MEVDCEGCAGCCLDWRDIAPDSVELDHERRGGLVPLDDTYNLVPLTSDDVRTFLRDGLGDTMTPRLFAAEDYIPSVEVGSHEIAAIEGRPVFAVGLRKPPKPVAPFGTDPTWLPSCVFLDPTTLQCRIHGEDRYPAACETYPRDNLTLDVETECERVETAFGGERLLDSDAENTDPLLGPGALGATIFAHPAPDRLTSLLDRVVDGELTAEDRADFVAIAAATHPGSLDVDADRYEAARKRVLKAESWVGAALDEWRRRAETDDADPSLGTLVEDRRGAPETPGW
jgi:Fe-S-cluster containining protein